MIATGKKDNIKEELNYVKIDKSGWAIYTNAFVLFKKGITIACELEKDIYVHIDEWKKIGSKEVSLIAYTNGVAAFMAKTEQIQCIAKEDIEYPNIDALKPGETVFSFQINISNLELIIKQLKMEKKHTVCFELTDTMLSKIKDTEHIFTRYTK